MRPVLPWRGLRWPACAVIGLSILGAAIPIHAQSTSEPRLAVSIGPEWLGRADLGGRDATLTRNPSGVTPLFDTRSTLAGGMGASAGFGVRLTRQLWLEGLGRYHSARLSTRVTRDVEASDTTASQAIQHLVIESGVLWMPSSLRVGARVQFYAAGGFGYLRQLHGTSTLAEAGRSYHAGGGAVIALPRRPGGTFKASGVRLEVRGAAVSGGVAFDNRVHAASAVWTALFLRF